MRKNKKIVLENTPMQKALKTIFQQVRYFNSMYGADPALSLFLTTERERAIEGAKVMSYGEQYANDIASITLHQAFGFADERQKRFCEVFVQNYNYFREEERKDLEVDEDKVYSTAKFEELLKAAAGKYYCPREDRYRFTIRYNGELVCGDDNPNNKVQKMPDNFMEDIG